MWLSITQALADRVRVRCQCTHGILWVSAYSGPPVCCLGMLLRHASLSFLHQLTSSFAPGCCIATPGREGYRDLSRDKDTTFLCLYRYILGWHRNAGLKARWAQHQIGCRTVRYLPARLVPHHQNPKAQQWLRRGSYGLAGRTAP